MKIPSFDRNQPFNDLPLLPPSEEVLTKGVLLKWGIAGRELAQLNKNVLRLPNPTMLVNTISLQEARTSSEIENIFTTTDDLYKAISEKHKEDSANPNVKEVLRYREALWAGYAEIKDKSSLDTNLIVKVFQQVKNTEEGIRPSHSLTTIKRGNSELKPGEIIYTPPRGKGVVEKKLENLIQYLNQNDLDPLLKMVIGHYQFEAIHPFTDGNGRTGRILNILVLNQSGLLEYPVLYLSNYIIENKEDYYYLLNAVTQRNSWEKWIMFMLEAVEQTARHTNNMVDEISEQMESTMTFARSQLKWYNREVNEIIFSQPYIKPSKLAKVLGRTSRTTMTKYFSELVRLKILSAKQDGKEVFYVNNDLMRILGG